MEISWVDRVRDEVLHRGKEQRNILHTINRSKVDWIGHILRGNCLLKYIIEGKIEGRREVTGRRGKRRKQLLDDLKEMRGYRESHSAENSLWQTLYIRRQSAPVMDARTNA